MTGHGSLAWLVVLTAAPAFAEPPSSERCGVCHVEQLAQWRASGHAAAGTNHLYSVAHEREPMRWCDGCHAPVQGNRAEGVSCTTCHMRGGEVLSSGAPSAAALAAHPTRREPLLARSEFCGTCHQFNFPVGRAEPVQDSANPMQNTLAEWRQSGDGRSCQECHLAQGDHRMGGAHDLARLRASVGVKVEAIGGGEVRVSVWSIGVAHALPTGDPFRRLRVELCSDSSCEEAIAARELGNSVVPTADSWWLDASLTVPPPGPAGGRIALEFSAPGARYYRVLYAYAAPSSEPALEPDERVAFVTAGSVTIPTMHEAEEAGSTYTQ